MAGVIYCGDNREVMDEYIPAGSVDLVYLDPPFNSKRTYNIVYKDSKSNAADEAFKDCWSWEEAAPTFHSAVESPETPKAVRTILRGLYELLVEQDPDLLAYLSMMIPRLVAIHRALKHTGTMYLHCDPTASHYLKVVLDAIFGPTNFLNEVVWKRTHSHGDPKRNFGSVTDTLLVYAKSSTYHFQPVYRPFASDYAEKRFSGRDEDGRRWQSVTLRSPSPRPNLHYKFRASNGVTYLPHRNGWSCEEPRMRQYDSEGRLHFPSKPGGNLRLKMYLDESKGVKVQSLWDDIPPVNSQAAEREGYPTQKPLALLERIIAASSRPGDLVLDPFCGCGTTVEAAERMGRRWIGIDIAHRAVSVIEGRFARVGLDAPKIIWHPADFQAAEALAQRDKRMFEDWVRRKVRAVRMRKRDRGIDGEATFRHEGKNFHVILSVKGGESVTPTFVRDLRGTVDRENAAVGVLVSLREPSKECKREASTLGILPFSDAEGPIPRMQLVTVERLFSGKPAIRAPGTNVTEMPRKSVPPALGDQLELGLTTGRTKAERPANAQEARGPVSTRPSSKSRSKREVG